MGTWRRGVVDDASYVQGPAQALVIIHCPHVSTVSLNKQWGVQRNVYACLLCHQYLASLTLAWMERGMSL